VNEETVTTETENVVWPPFGLPLGYTPLGYVPPTDEASLVPPPVNITENQPRTTVVQPGNVTSQESPKDCREVYQGPELVNGEPMTNSAIPQLEEARQKFKAIEDRLRRMEGGVDSLNFSDMCLVPDLVLPSKFKIPNFEKYKGLSCPKNHLIMYNRKMASYANNHKLMIHWFQDKRLERLSVGTCSWREVVSVLGEIWPMRLSSSISTTWIWPLVVPNYRT
jgi:hypothetical protein